MRDIPVFDKAMVDELPEPVLPALVVGEGAMGGEDIWDAEAVAQPAALERVISIQALNMQHVSILEVTCRALRTSLETSDTTGVGSGRMRASYSPTPPQAGSRQH